MNRAASIDGWLGRHRQGALVLLDCLSWGTGIVAFTVLRYVDMPQSIPWPKTLTGIAIAIGVHLTTGALLWIFDARHPVGSREDALAVAKTVCVTTAILMVISMFFPGGRLLAVTVPFAAGACVLSVTMGARLLWRTLHESTLRPEGALPAILLGAGNAAGQLILQMHTDPNSPFLPVALLDDDPKKRHLRIHGIPVLGNRTDLRHAVEKTGAVVLIVAIPSAASALYRDVTEQATSMGLRVQVLPTLHRILDGRVGLRDLRDIDICDLLGRDPVSTDVAASAGYLEGKRVLVTGAGGSIGSELCRQLLSFAPAGLFMLDRDESALQALQLSIAGHGLLDTEDVVLADIRDRAALDTVFDRVRPQVVFHAAALKHLPMLEQYPDEAWKTNVLGTANVLEAAQRVDVDVFVNISTDKAANPTSVLGHSKRLAERLTAAVAEETPGKFVSARFGNVLGSRGSVLPAFTAQIEAGGPVTVTHPDVTRYFMMIPEACELVIQTAAVGRDGEALVLDMGHPVRILDVANQMIQMSGRDDIEIVFTGLRAGEKLHEELFGETEGRRSTRHALIDAVPVPPLAISEVRAFPVQPSESAAAGRAW